MEEENPFKISSASIGPAAAAIADQQRVLDRQRLVVSIEEEGLRCKTLMATLRKKCASKGYMAVPEDDRKNLKLGVLEGSIIEHRTTCQDVVEQCLAAKLEDAGDPCQPARQLLEESKVKMLLWEQEIQRIDEVVRLIQFILCVQVVSVTLVCVC